MKKTFIIFTLLATALNMLPLFLLAQDPGGGPDVPIDGGLSILLAAGTAYGVKKYREGVRKNKKEME
jgi:hypothetical protein